MQLKNEEQILDENFRLKVIKEINGQENVERKKKAFKKYELYKDKIKKYLEEAFKKEGLKAETIALMLNRATNVAIVRKIVNKLARSYSSGVIRAGENEAVTEQINAYVEMLDLNKQMKKADRYRELYKNAMLQVLPEVDDDSELYDISVRVLSPWQYDVIEDYRDRENARVLILSDYYGEDASALWPGSIEQTRQHQRSAYEQSNGIDDIIADSPADQKQKTYIWWSEKYHFTTDAKGRIIAALSPDDLLNPIQEEPFVNVADDQDGFFWAEGGDDLTEGAVLVNQLMTDMNSIAYIQGYGQLVVTGKNLPERFTMGPHNALVFDYDEAKGEPKPEVTVVNANPPLDSWMKAIEQYVALILSANSLSPATLSTKLDSNNFPSGIAMLIEMSEASNDVSDEQKKFSDVEKKLWERIAKWHNLYYSKNLLCEEASVIGAMPEDLELKIKFLEPKPATTEKEKLETIKQRKELGINTMTDLIMIDNPGLNLEDAKAKLEEIQKEKKENLKQTMETMGAPVNGELEDDSMDAEEPEVEDVNG